MATFQDQLDNTQRLYQQQVLAEREREQQLWNATPTIQPTNLFQTLGERTRGAGSILGFGESNPVMSNMAKGLYGLGAAAGPELLQAGKSFGSGLMGTPQGEDTSGSFLENANSAMNDFDNFELFPSSTKANIPPQPALGVDTSNIPEMREGGDISALSIDVNGIPSRKVVTPDDMEDAADVHQRMGTDATTVTPQEAASTAGIAKASMEAQGKSFETQQEAPEGIENSVWKGFNDQFDLTTIGLTLMATAQNGNDLGVNLGLAMQAGRVAKTASKDKAIAKQEKDDAKARQARADLAAQTQQEFDNTIDTGKFIIDSQGNVRAASKARREAEGQPLQEEAIKAQIKLRQAQAFKAYADARKAEADITGQNIPPISATLQNQGVDVLTSAGMNGKKGDPDVNRLGKIYAELAEDERRNGFVGDPASKIIDYMNRNGFFRDTSWLERGNFAPADLGKQLGLN